MSDCPPEMPTRSRSKRSRSDFQIAIAVGWMLALGGCATIPKAELGAYNESFQAAQAAAKPIIADYAVAERAARQSQLRRTLLDCEIQPCPRLFDHGYYALFRVEDARAVSTIGLPPGADALDRAFRAIQSYNETLVALAEGRNIDEAKGQLRSIIADLGPLAGIAAPEVAALNATSQLLVDALKPAITEGNRREFLRLVLDGQDEVVTLIDLVQGFSDDQFLAVTRPLVDREAIAPDSEKPAIRDKINHWHTVFADYVILLDAMKSRLGDLKEVALHPKEEALLARASRGSAELRVYAETLQRSIDELHAAR